ncbi:PREDICTED: putative G3BP-like protein [Brassica oleracea var. oleracea]|uniref:putative G3BP-like protein n=1 Tax=Brassica oleracea var. oleracea TaxID=109376 RepID=UPI0006A6D074|nr:PREDICTED: putative G3BP-like protein [Brassica oleracea var. oleracea]
MTPVSNAPSVDAQIVGNAFVQKYYTHLYEKPAEVYKFYLEESVLGRPGVGGEMVSVKSLKAINDQIMSVDYQNSKIQILTADSQPSLKSAVVTLVAGLVIGKDGERKSFTQSFFLVPQNGSYFVLNDVFRYVSDVFVAPEATKEAEVEAVVEESPQETAPAEPAKDVVEPAAEATAEEKVVNGNSNLPKAAAEAKPQEDAGPKKSFAVIAAQNGAQINAKASPVKPKPVEKPRVAPQAEAPAPVAAPQPKAPSAKTTQQPAQGGSIFVANLPMDATPEQLFETFKGFGAIRRGGIQVRSYTEQRNCFGFVAFENSESIKNVFKAHNESPIIIGNRRASIEEKRVNNNENGGRAYARNNGNNRNENGYRKDGYRPRGNGANGGRGSGRNGPERQSGDAKASQNGHGNAQAKN